MAFNPSLSITDNCPILTFTDTTDQTGITDVTTRNMVLIKPDGTYAQLGNAVAQVNVLTLNNSAYTIGQTFIFTWCSITFTVTVVTNRTDPTCVALDIASAFAAQTGNIFSKISATVNGNVVTLTMKEAGLPFTIVITGTATSVSFVNTVANVPNMDVYPSSNNTVTYSPNESGGLYLVKLYVLESCTFNEFDGDFYNWCSDIQTLNCCIAKKMLSLYSAPSCKTSQDDIHQLRDKLDSINNFKGNPSLGAQVGLTVISALGDCEDCGC